MFVYVINQHGRPLMPCHPRRARLLLKQGKARVATCEPFTIQLLYGSSGYTQPIALGVDAGSKMKGGAAFLPRLKPWLSCRTYHDVW
jgi:hypothetical protein